LCYFFPFCVFVGYGRKESVSGKILSLRANWEDLEDVVKFNRIKERIKSEFIQLESKLDWIQIWILHMSWYFGHNFQLEYLIEVIIEAFES
jgi:hypothetical protein